MTDAELDSLIEQSRANLRACIRNVVEGKSPWNAFDIGEMKLPNGAKWSITLSVMTEPYSKLSAQMVGPAIGEFLTAFQKAAPAQTPATPTSTPTPAKTTRFAVPGA